MRSTNRLVFGVLTFSSFSSLMASPIKYAAVSLSDKTVIENVKVFDRKLSEQDLTFMGFEVGKTSLYDVQKKMTTAHVKQKNYGSTGVHILCYVGADGTLLSFESDDSVGGEEHVITEVSLSDAKVPYRFKEFCGKSSDVTREVTSASGLRLGLTSSQVKKSIGTAGRDMPGILVYQFKKDEGAVQITSTVYIELKENRISRLTLSKVAL